MDQIDGAYIDKRRFLIFDYCGNFEYFRQHQEGYECQETKTLSENIFGKRIRLAMALQDSAFAEDRYQRWRSELVSLCHGQVEQLEPQLVAVKLRLLYVEKYRQEEAFRCISDTDRGEVLGEIAPLVRSADQDELAKRFDNFMYGMMLAHLEQLPTMAQARKQLCSTAALLERKSSIPQVRDKLPILKEVQTEEFWQAGELWALEQARRELRGLIQFLDEGGEARRKIFTHLADPVIDRQEGKGLDKAYDFENYREKVSRYVNEHSDTLAIHKLTHNISLSSGDYQELERVLTQELGSQEDHTREFGDTPFGLLVRKIAKLDHEAAMGAFSQFINDASLNQQQIAFVHKVIRHVELNGYMDSVAELTRPPFDKPVSFVKLFDQRRQMALVEAVKAVRNNATNIQVS